MPPPQIARELANLKERHAVICRELLQAKQEVRPYAGLEVINQLAQTMFELIDQTQKIAARIEFEFDGRR